MLREDEEYARPSPGAEPIPGEGCEPVEGCGGEAPVSAGPYLVFTSAEEWQEYRRLLERCLRPLHRRPGWHFYGEPTHFPCLVQPVAVVHLFLDAPAAEGVPLPSPPPLPRVTLITGERDEPRAIRVDGRLLPDGVDTDLFRIFWFLAEAAPKERWVSIDQIVAELLRGYRTKRNTVKARLAQIRKLVEVAGRPGGRKRLLYRMAADVSYGRESGRE